MRAVKRLNGWLAQLTPQQKLVVGALSFVSITLMALAIWGCTYWNRSHVS